MTVRILLVDDHEIMREAISALLGKCEDVEVVGQAEDGRTAIELVDQLHPDVAIVDIAMPKLNGIDATRQMIKLYPNLKVMALSAHSEGHLVAQMIQAGASGFMHKDSTFAELKKGIQMMLEGQTFLCSRISKVVFSDYVNFLANSSKSDTEVLSNREREVLQLIAEGHTSKEIAQTLEISPKTADSHREHIMKKLDIRTIPDLTKYAIRKGLTTR